MTGMQSRKDLYQAHRLMAQRASLALLLGEPDVPDQPLRRLNVAAFSSALVAVIVAAIFALIAILGHGSSALTLKPGLLLIDKDTGAPYVVCQKRKLCQALNYASARLALGSAPAGQQTVSQQDLAKYPRGPQIGILGLPDLPAPSQLIKGPWAVCTRAELAGSAQPSTTALAAGTDPGGEPLRDEAVGVQAADQDWVIWHGQRFAVRRRTLEALTSSAKQPAAVAPAWLGALAQGPDLAAPAIPGAGDKVPAPGGGTTRVGQVYRVTPSSGSPGFYVMLGDGLAKISQTQEQLLEFKRGQPAPLTLSPSQISGNLSKESPLPSNGLPRHMPTITPVNVFTTLCDVYQVEVQGKSALIGQVTTGGNMPAGGSPVAAPSGTGQTVSQIVLPPGAGALAGSAPGGAGPGQGAAQPGQGAAHPPGSAVTYYLIAGGRRFGLASKKVAATLGYSLPAQSVALPARVVDLIPLGPALNPAAASKPVAPG